MNVSIEEWTQEHKRWSEVEEIVATMGQIDWVEPVWDWHLSSHVLVAFDSDSVVGFLRFVTQTIGVEEDHTPIAIDGEELVEAKVLAFGVLPRYRRQGVGLKLQESLLSIAKGLRCFQVRSHSSGDNIENHMLKLKMGFAVQPVVRGKDVGGVYFLKCLSDGGT